MYSTCELLNSFVVDPPRTGWAWLRERQFKYFYQLLDERRARYHTKYSPAIFCVINTNTVSMSKKLSSQCPSDSQAYDLIVLELVYIQHLIVTVHWHIGTTSLGFLVIYKEVNQNCVTSKMILKNFCFCIPLKIGVVGIACLTFIWSLVSIVLNLINKQNNSWEVMEIIFWYGSDATTSVMLIIGTMTVRKNRTNVGLL